ncbi:MAG: hypothetical protein E7547_09140 [Ruminococcaceae bacterium]|nr:hypothetical protein [Oscillospiraceae bacterium]
MINKNVDVDSLVTVVELSELFGVSVRTVQRLAQEGVLPEPEGKQGNANLYSLKRATRAYCDYLKKKVEQQADNSGDKLKEEKMQADIKLKEMQIEIIQLKTDIKKGEYIDRGTVLKDFRAFYKVFKRFALNIPGRIAAIAKGYVEPVVSKGIKKDLRQEITSMLNNFTVVGYKGETYKQEKPYPSKRHGRK